MMKKLVFALLAVLVIGTSINPLSAANTLPATTTTDPDPARVKAAIEEFRNLPKAERKSKIKELRKELKKFKAAKKAGKEPSTDTVLLVILAIILPPLAVYLYEGEINKRFWISLLLTLLFWLPGIIYALVLILGKK